MIITDLNFLRQKCEPVDISEINDLRSLLEKELQNSSDNGKPGIGLSAIQVGILKKFAIVRMKTEQGLMALDLANAEIEKGYDEKTFFEEGCLSFPDQLVKTSRFQEVVIRNNLIPPYRFSATGLLAVCCQHEIGHYNQKLMFDFAIDARFCAK